jgi:hypothetical protein
VSGDSGRSPASAGSGSQASPEAAGASSPSVSIPNAVHVVIRSVGAYERDETPIRAFPTAKAANDFIKRAEREWAAAVAAVSDVVDYPPDGAPDEEWARWARRRNRQWGRFRSYLTCDRAAGPRNEWSSPDEPSYFACRVPFAQAIEARRAATGTGAVEDESAVGNADAPDPPPSPKAPIMNQGDPKAMLELADRVEKASGPDRGLDVHIWAAVNGISQAHVDAIMACVRLSLNVECCPLYTASLDAAMTLVPKEFEYQVESVRGAEARHRAYVERPGVTSFHDRDAATPALALTAACLRALANGGNHG